MGAGRLTAEHGGLRPGQMPVERLPYRIAKFSHTVRARPGPLSALAFLSVFLCKSVFVWRFCMGAQGA
jgi:hypothetical protein